MSIVWNDDEKIYFAHKKVIEAMTTLKKIKNKLIQKKNMRSYKNVKTLVVTV